MNYVADFMCKEFYLVIEVDGVTHDLKLEMDERRTDDLRRAGFHVYRFTDEEVLTNIHGVAREIEKIIKHIGPPPAPPPRVPFRVAGDNQLYG